MANLPPFNWLEKRFIRHELQADGVPFPDTEATPVDAINVSGSGVDADYDPVLRRLDLVFSGGGATVAANYPVIEVDVDAGSPALVVKDWVCASTTAGKCTKITPNALYLAGQALGLVIEAPVANKVKIAIPDGGWAPPTLTDLVAAAPGYVRVNPSTARVERTLDPLWSDHIVGYVDPNSWLALSRAPAGLSRFKPTDVPGCFLWCILERDLTIVSGAASLWGDQSGYGAELVQSTPANRPTLTANQLHGRPVLVGDGSNDLMAGTLAAPLTGNAAHSIVVVGKIDTLTASAFKGFFSLGDAGNTSTIGYEGSLPNKNWYGGHNNAAAGTLGGNANTSWHVRRKMHNGTTQTGYIDGVEEQASATVTYTLDTALNLFTYRSAASPIAGKIAEVIAYSRHIGTAAGLRVDRYLGTRHAIAVA